MNEQNQSPGQTQNAPTKKPWYKKWWVIAIGVVILIGVIGSSGEDKKDDKSAPEQSQQVSQADEKAEPKAEPKKEERPAEPEKLTPQITITSVNIAKEYSENEVAADEKYKGKMIEISGKVTSIDNGTFDNEMIVKLTDGQYDFNGPWCYMKESEKDKVLAFKKGQQVTLIGTGDSATLKSPILKSCVVK